MRDAEGALPSGRSRSKLKRTASAGSSLPARKTISRRLPTLDYAIEFISI
jgi:hypothetical protein